MTASRPEGAINFRHDARGWPLLDCPKGHEMGWLGLAFWLCSKCRPSVIYVSAACGWIKR